MRTLLSVLFASLFACASVAGEPLLSQGIGASRCGDLVADIKPAEALFNQINLMLYAWVQGYVSAANVALLEYDSKHIDMTDLDASRVLSMILDYCKANPDKRPANALDAFIKTAKKGKAQWKTGTVEWDE
ncbi:MAG TPA: hypothetical protein VLN57_05100 [Xanthobacteraceae bacterium]|jgi:hypothetical protein|nr:hypothetical protein [Xanthobacteraceae bacterium]